MVPLKATISEYDLLIRHFFSPRVLIILKSLVTTHSSSGYRFLRSLKFLRKSPHSSGRCEPYTPKCRDHSLEPR